MSFPSIPVKCVRIHPITQATPPFYASRGASAFDFVAAIDESLKLYPGERVIVRSGLKIAVPPGYELQVRPRSGKTFKEGLTVLNSPGTIDSDYRGEVGIIVVNHSQDIAVIHPGDRIAQGAICPVYQADFYFVDSLDETERGENGFGSTGG